MSVARSRRIVAAAGRRIDKPETTEPDFPSAREREVADRTRAELAALGAAYLIASAASGADIIVLEAARALGVPYEIVLPFAIERFKRESVEDQGKTWASRFDDVWRHADSTVVIEEQRHPAWDAYSTVNAVILEHGNLKSPSPAAVSRTALLLWSGKRRTGIDYTADFRDQALAAGWSVREILTTSRE